MEIFDGVGFAQLREEQLIPQVDALRQKGVKLVIAAILFTQDVGSQLYTRLKREAAQRVGIEYQIYNFSLLDPVEAVVKKIHELNSDPEITGIIIQKPSKTRAVEVFAAALGKEITSSDFQAWWSSLVIELNPAKDVDGLHPATLAAVETGTWKREAKVLPATAQAVLAILDTIFTPTELKAQQICILGKSDILGKPLFYELRNSGCQVEMIGSAELKAKGENGTWLKDKQVIISATGRKHLITGEMVSEGVAIIDVGEPKPDLDLVSVQDKAWFVTPVPGGVGPVTVVSLLENAVKLGQFLLTT